MGNAMVNQDNTALDLADALESRGDEYLTFRLGKEDYGVDILRVQEIRGWEMVTRVPNQPEFVKGVLNLRGAIVPIFDLRLRLGMPFLDYGKETVVIVLRIKDDKGDRSIGVLVDAVSDVLNASASDIRGTPELGSGIDTEVISGLATSGERMIMIIDADKLLEARTNQLPDQAD